MQRAGEDIRCAETEVGVHTYHNLMLGVANAVAGIKAGAVRVDAPLAGEGAGAGNAPIKELMTVLDRIGSIPVAICTC